MLIWRHVDPRLLGEFPVQAARSYARSGDGTSRASAEASETAPAAKRGAGRAE